MMALAGGAALIGAALLYYFSRIDGEDLPDYVHTAQSVQIPEIDEQEIAAKIA